MRYHLSYNEQTGQFRIDEQGKTIKTIDAEMFEPIKSSDDLWPLILAYNLARCGNAEKGLIMKTSEVLTFLNTHQYPFDENHDLVLNTGF